MGKRVAGLVGLVLCLTAGILIVLEARSDDRPREAAATTRPAPARPHVAPTRRKVRGAHNAPVPILMYHVIAAPPAGAAYPDLYVRPADFAGQLRWLARHGYHAVTLRAVYDFWRFGYALPAHPIVFSFDDGYASHFAVVRPLLARLHWPGVLNLEVAHLKPGGGLSARKVRVLIRAGWEIDAHTLTHPDLTAVDPSSLRHEVAGSRNYLRRTFGVPVEFFCYPSGRYDTGVIREVARAGFLGATTTEYGLASPRNPYTLARIRVGGSDGVRGLAQRMMALSGKG